jgi:hypothetical protein
LRGRRTLEEAGPNLVVRCNNVVLKWPIRDGAIDQFEEKESGDEEEEGGGVVWEVGKEEDGQDREKGGQQLPEADFGVAGHPGVSVARKGCGEKRISPLRDSR